MRAPTIDLRPAFVAAMATCALALAAPATAATTSQEYVGGAIPIVPTSDVAYAGTAIFVGRGAFGAGTESIARLDADGTLTTIVTGLNSIGGIAFDAAGDRLVFTDNALEAPGSPATGDTVYALPAPLAATSSVAASTLQLVPSGSIPFAQAVLALPDGRVLVGDAAGFGNGRVVAIHSGAASDLIAGLDFTAGVSFDAAANELWVADVDSTSFTGAVLRFALDGTPVGVLASGLGGAYDQSLDGAGNLLVTGGFTGDFSSSTVVRVSPSGDAEDVAEGFAFSTGIDVDGPSGQTAVVDFAADEISTLTPVDRLTPGGTNRRECQAELWGGTFDTKRGKIKSTWSCQDGDPACDRDLETDGSCRFLIGTCFSVSDARVPSCSPAPIDAAIVERRPKVAGSVAFPALQAASGEVLPSSAAACSRAVPIDVPARKKVKVKVRAVASGRSVDTDTLLLRCLP